MSDPIDQERPSDTPAAAAHPEREGRSRSAPADRVGTQRFQHSDAADAAEPAPHGEPVRTPSERDESPSDQVPVAPTGQTMRRAEPGAPGVIEQAYEDVERGLQDTDLYGSGNLAGPDDKGRRPDASVDRADGQDPVRRSGHDVGTD